MNNRPLGTLCAATLLMAASACQSPRMGESDVSMSWAQNNAMYGVLNDVRKQARKQRVETGAVGMSTVLELLADRDAEIQQVLSEDQWLAYDAGERLYYATRIVRSVWDSPIGGVSTGNHAGGGGTGYTGPGLDAGSAVYN